MLAEILFRIRRSLPDLGRLLGSWRLSVVLMVVAALYQGLLGVFSALSAPAVVQRISQLMPFWIVWILLLANTGVCLWRRFPALRRDLKAEPVLAKSAPDSEMQTSPDLDREAAAGVLRGLGFGATVDYEGGLWGVRQRWAPLGTYLFHGSFFVVILAAALTMAARQEDRVWVAVGEEYTGEADQILSRSRPRAAALRPPPSPFVVESITPEFWRGELLFTRLEANLLLPDGRRAITRINRPLWQGWWTFVRLSGFGYAPRYALADRQGEVLESAFVKMRVFPPGQGDFFHPARYPHRIDVEVMPNAVEQDGRLVNRSLDLADPVVIAEVSRGKLLLGRAVLRPGESFEFEGLRLSFPEIAFWGEFAIVHDPGIPVLFFGFAVGIVGLLLKVRGRRAEASWSPGSGGKPGQIGVWGPARHLPDALADEEEIS